MSGKRKTSVRSAQGCQPVILAFIGGISLIMFSLGAILLGGHLLDVWTVSGSGLVFNTPQPQPTLAVDNSLNGTATQEALIFRQTQEAFQLTGTSLAGTQIAMQRTPANPPPVAPTTVPVQPTITPNPAPEISGDCEIPPGSRTVIDDTFDNDINRDVWEFDASSWAINGTNLIPMHEYSYLKTTKDDFNNYMVEIWLGTNNRQNRLVLHLDFNLPEYGSSRTRAIARMTFTENTIYAHLSRTASQGGNASNHANQIPGSQKQVQLDNTFIEDIVYVCAKVIDRRFIVTSEEHELINMRLLDVSPEGRIGFFVPNVGIPIHRIRITELNQ